MSVVHTRFGFKTAYLQRECVEDVAVCSSETNDYFRVGQLCSYTPASGSVPGYITKKTTPAAGDWVIAQSDQTMGDGPTFAESHIPVENRDYRYSDKVAITASKESLSAADTGAAVKKIAFFKVVDPTDLVAIS